MILFIPCIPVQRVAQPKSVHTPRRRRQGPVLKLYSVYGWPSIVAKKSSTRQKVKNKRRRD